MWVSLAALLFGVALVLPVRLLWTPFTVQWHGCTPHPVALQAVVSAVYPCPQAARPVSCLSSAIACAVCAWVDVLCDHRLWQQLS